MTRQTVIKLLAGVFPLLAISTAQVKDNAWPEAFIRKLGENSNCSISQAMPPYREPVAIFCTPADFMNDAEQRRAKTLKSLDLLEQLIDARRVRYTLYLDPEDRRELTDLLKTSMGGADEKRKLAYLRILEQLGVKP